MFKTYRVAVAPTHVTVSDNGTSLKTFPRVIGLGDKALDLAFNYLLTEHKRGLVAFCAVPHSPNAMDRTEHFLVTTLPLEEPNAAD